MIIYKEKIFFINKKPTIDIRNYERTKALKKNENLVIVVDKIGQMTLSYQQLKNKSKILHKQIVKSKIYPDQKYCLLSYEWLPDKSLTSQQELQQMMREGNL